MFLLTHQTQPQVKQQHHHHQRQQQITSKPNPPDKKTTTISLSLSLSSAMPPQHSTVDHSAIIKGKRTKRPRSTSPASSNPPPLPLYDLDDYNSNRNTSILSTSSGEIYESTEEEEDMANCLIMLAQGNGNRFESLGSKQNDGVSIHARNGTTSSKFSEIATTNRAGFFVYECKTCNRSFPSFQALGGHRASHKKPRTIAGEEKINKAAARETIHVHGEETEIGSAPTDLALQISSTVNNKAKVHECSICGAEFSSGQALGGHMRRHRAAMMGNQAAVSAETTVDSSNGTDHDIIKQRNVLSLDLNLPAPEEDHHLHSSPKFQFGASPPSTALVFSTPALVDCHY